MQSSETTSTYLPRPPQRRLRQPWPRVVHLLIIMGLISSGLFNLAQPAYAASITVNGTTCTLANAITAANTDTATSGCPAGSGADTITIAADVTLAAALPKIASDLTIQGDTPTRFVSGDQKFRVFWVQSGKVTLQNLTIRNGQATGSNGNNGNGSTVGGGGGALGAGGGLYIHSGNVTVTNVTFRQNVAQGGNGARYGTPFSNGQGGHFDNTGGGVAGTPGAAGGFGAGGGSAVVNALGAGVAGGLGSSHLSRGGAMGGAGSLLGARGLAIDPGNVASGGAGGAIGGGGGGVGPKGTGGGGGGAGGAIFIRMGTLTLNNNTFTQNVAAGGSPGGKGEGAAVFVCTREINPDCGTLLAPGFVLPTQVVVAAAGVALPGTAQGNNSVAASNVAGQGKTIFPAALVNSINPKPLPIGAANLAGKTMVSRVLAATQATVSDLPPGLTGVVALVGGDAHGLALRNDGTLVAWGDNSFGQGVVPADLSGIVGIAAGAYHNLALKSDGTLAAWGDNRLGQSTIPAGLSGVVAIAAGGYHNLALKSDGTVVAWGSNALGQASVPAGLSDVIALAAGAEHSLALKGDGTLVTWGNNGYDQLAIPAGLDDVAAIAVGQYHSLALRMGGTVVAWGRNDIGQIAVPADLSDVVMIAANYYHSLALKSDGTVVTWGGNNDGQRDLPANLGGIVAIAAGGQNTLLIEATDSTPPTTQLTSSEGYNNTTSAQFWFTGEDDVTPAPGLTFQCQLDGSAFSECTSPQSYSNLAVGSHTFAVKAVDAAGNGAVSPESYTWTINPPAPILEVETPGGQQLVVAAQNSSTPLDFGTATINRASTVRQITLYNTGNANLVISGASFSGAHAGDFSVSGTLPTIAPNSGALLAVTFAPTAAGLRQATLTLNSNAAPYSVDLQGTGTADPYPVLSIPDAAIKVTNNRFTVPVQLATNGASLAAVGFVLNYANSCLTFDTTDSDNDGIPDAITGLPAAFAPSVSHQSTAAGGALEIALVDDLLPIATMTDGPLLTLAFGVASSCVTTDGALSLGEVGFATTPAVSFGAPNAVDVAGAATGAAIPLQFNAAPTALALSNNELSENTPAGATIGTISVTDPDGGDTHSYSLVAGEGDTDNAAFTLQGTTLKTAVALNYEPKPEYRVRVRVTDNGGLVYEQAFVIKTIDLSEAPTGIATTDGPISDGNPATVDIKENQPAGTLVAKLDPANPDTNNSYTYALVAGAGDTDNASFAIVDNQLRSAASFDYESKASYTIRLQITDKLARSVQQPFTILINNVEEALNAVDDLIDPRTTIFVGGQATTIDVLVNDQADSGTLAVASVTQPATGGGSVSNNTTDVSYTAPNANGSTNFTYRATNGIATSNDATVSVSYVANNVPGDCNANGAVTAADFVGVVLEIFDANDLPYNNDPAWWLVHTGDYAGSPLGCDANGRRNGTDPDNPTDSITAADIICTVLLFFGHECGSELQAAGAGATAQVSVLDTSATAGTSTVVTVTLDTAGNGIVAATFALVFDPTAVSFTAEDGNEDGIPDGVVIHAPAMLEHSVSWNAAAHRLEVALFSTSLPLPTLNDGVLATVTLNVAADAPVESTPLALELVTISDANGNDLAVNATDGTLTIFLPTGQLDSQLFLPLISR